MTFLEWIEELRLNETTLAMPGNVSAMQSDVPKMGDSVVEGGSTVEVDGSPVQRNHFRSLIMRGLMRRTGPNSWEIIDQQANVPEPGSFPATGELS